MLSSVEVRCVVDRLTYRDWCFFVYLDQHEGLAVEIGAEVVDGYHPDRRIWLDVHAPLPPFRDEQAVVDWFAWRLARAESHESREMLRLDGQLVSDPHAGP